MKILLGTPEVSQLFGRTDAETLDSLVNGELPQPCAWQGETPLWDRGAIERLANRHWSKSPDRLVWVHPKTWASAKAAADEQYIYSGCGAVIFGDGERFYIHVPADPRPANKLRMLLRYGRNTQWSLKAFVIDTGATS